MTIKTKLLLSTLIEIFLMLFVAVFSIASSRQAGQLAAKEAKAGQIVEAVTQIRFVTFENLLHHDERSYEQWQNKHTGLGVLLQSITPATPTENMLINDIKIQHQAIEPIFARLVESYNSPSKNQNPDVIEEYQERLTSQIVLKQQIQISQSLKLAEIERSEALGLRRRSGWVVFLAFIGMFLISIINFFFVAVAISKALTHLQKGASKIAAGELRYRIKLYARNELGQLAAAFNSMAAKLEQVDRIKSEFVSLASHQLRTPATGVKVYASMLIDGYAGAMTPKQTEFMQKIYESNQHQLRIIGDLLNTDTMASGHINLNLSQVNLSVLLADSLQEHREIELRHQTLKVVVPKNDILAEGDADKLRMVVDNLIGNASKYTPVGGKISAELKPSTTHVAIIIKDTGVGIAAKDLDKLFKRFSRIDNPLSNEQGAGSGLGLYLAKGIIEAHGGRISVNSIPGHGSTFIVELPYKVPTTSAAIARKGKKT